MECDLHGLEQAEAYIEIIHALKECKTENDNKIHLIHGYHSGTALKSYIQSPKFLAQMKKHGFRLTRIKSSNQGTSSFVIGK